MGTSHAEGEALRRRQVAAIAEEVRKRGRKHASGEPLFFDKLNLELAIEAALAPLSGPVDASGEPAYWCCKLCKCLWRDNHDGTVSLASAKQTSCQTCEMEPSHVACEPLFLRSILVDRDAEVRREMRAYLDTFTIHGDNIGGIRRMLFMPFDSQWNGWVRDDTAAREVSATDLKSAAAAVPSSPAQPSPGFKTPLKPENHGLPPSSPVADAWQPITAGEIRTGLLDTFAIHTDDVFYRKVSAPSPSAGAAKDKE